MLTMETGTIQNCDQLSPSSPTAEEVIDLHKTTTFSDSDILSDNAHNINSEITTQQAITPVQSTMNQHLTCYSPSTTSQEHMNIHTGAHIPTQINSMNTHQVAVQNPTPPCVYTPQRTMKTPVFNCNNSRSEALQNQNMQYISCDPTDGLTTALHRTNGFSFSNSHVPDKNMDSDQYFLSPPKQDFSNKFPKSFSISADNETPSGTLGTVNASPSTQVGHDLILDHHMTRNSVPSHQTSGFARKNSKVPETIFHGLARNIGSSRSLLAQPMAKNEPPLVADVTDSAPNPSTNTLTVEGSGTRYTSPHVTRSEVTPVSGNYQSFAQTYASLTPWTSKLTAPGYVPLPVPTPDAMPIPIEHTSQEYLLSMPPPSQKISAKPWNSGPHRIYSHLKPNLVFGYHGDTLANSKKKNGYCNGALHAQRSGFKVLPNKEYRFRRTAEALQKSGLWEVAMKTGSLIKRNRELQRELEEFRSDAVAFLKSVIKNPQNRDFIKSVLNTALTSNVASRNGSSVMTVVVSAVAAAASSRLDSCGSSDGSSISGDLST